MSDPARPPKRAVILAGGKGTRLRPYTTVLPKPLMPVGDYPILEIVIRQLARQGFQHITLAVNHQANLVQAFFGDGKQWNVRIDYSIEPEPLGTFAPLLLIPGLPEHFLLMNGDVLTDLDLHAFWETHVSEDRNFTIAATERTETTDYGVLETDCSGKLLTFHEKPSRTHLVSMGIYMVAKNLLSTVPQGRMYGFDNLMGDLLQRGQPVQVVRHDGYWLDIGRPDDYAQAIEDVEKRGGELWNL